MSETGSVKDDTTSSVWGNKDGTNPFNSIGVSFIKNGVKKKLNSVKSSASKEMSNFNKDCTPKKVMKIAAGFFGFAACAIIIAALILNYPAMSTGFFATFGVVLFSALIAFAIASAKNNKIKQPKT